MNDDDDYYQGASWQRQLQWQREEKTPLNTSLLARTKHILRALQLHICIRFI